MPPRKTTKQSKQVEALKHKEAKRRNIPTAEHQSVMAEDEKSPIRVAYERRDRDLDPQLVWRGKDGQDWSDLVVSAPPLYIQEKIHPKVLIEDLVNSDWWLVNSGKKPATNNYPLATQLDLFADFNGLPKDATATEFYQHDANWTNRMILGDSLQVMASLAEREGLRGKVQCIYLDPPYGIKFNSNFQWSTTSRDVKDGKADHITREPEQVKAFRDTWRDGIHSYLTYLRDRLTVARDLLSDSGSIFVQIGDENVHRVRELMDEIFGDSNLIAFITIAKTSSATSEHLAGVADYVLFYAKNKESLKYRQIFRAKEAGGEGGEAYRFFQTEEGIRISAKEAASYSLADGKYFRLSDLRSPRPPGSFPVKFQGKEYTPKRGYWKTGEIGFDLLMRADRVSASASTLNYVRFIDDYPAFQINNIWTDLSSSVGADKVYVVQTGVGIVQRCILMATDPGDLVLDPTCGSGTTAYVAEQWGRRWITIDTSRVALALARARIMGARYPYYLLADSPEGQKKEAELSGKRVAGGEWIVDRKGVNSEQGLVDSRRVSSGQGLVDSRRVNSERGLVDSRRVNSERGLVDSKKSGLTTNNSPLTTNSTTNNSPLTTNSTTNNSPLTTNSTTNSTTNNSPLTTNSTTNYDIRQGFVYDRVPHITLKAIANNAEIDTIWEQKQPAVEAALADLNAALQGHKTPYKVPTGGREGKTVNFTASGTVKLPSGEDAPANALLEWEVPRTAPADWDSATHAPLEQFWQARIARQKAIDKSIAAKADQELLYDKPYEDKSIVRVAGPFTVESLSPHRVLAVDENDELVDSDVVNSDVVDSEESKLTTKHSSLTTTNDFANLILENLRTSGVQQAHKEDKITFTALVGWAGTYICAEGRYIEGENGQEKRAGIFIGPEFGTVSRADLVAAAREAGDAGFDVLITCAFNYDAHSADFTKLGRIPVLKARMNADLHMANDLKNTGAGNLFVIFGEPDILVASEEWLVDSSGVMVAPYEIFKLVSGVDSLAEINRLSHKDLCLYAHISNRREVWDYLTDATGSNFDPSEYSRRTGTQNHWGVSTVSWCCARIAGRTGNLHHFIREVILPQQDGFRKLVSELCRDWQNAKRTDEVSGEVNSGEWRVDSKKSGLTTNPSPLTTNPSPLTTNPSPLTTNPYSQVKIHGVDVFHPQSGEVRSSNADEIACWFIDTDYNEESFFVRHAYFLGASDPYKSLKTTLKAEIDEEAWGTLYGDTSRPFDKPKSGRIAVKAINHLGDEVMKVFSVD